MSLTVKFLLLILLSSSASLPLSAQGARLDLERLNGLEKKARDVVHVDLDGRTLELAKRVALKVDDPNVRKLAEAISGVKGIYVRVYDFQNDNEYDPADLDIIRKALSTPGWERMANVRSKVNDQKIDVFTNFDSKTMNGMAVVISESRRIAVVNVLGSIDFETLVEIGGKFNIPKLNIIKTH